MLPNHNRYVLLLFITGVNDWGWGSGALAFSPHPSPMVVGLGWAQPSVPPPGVL